MVKINKEHELSRFNLSQKWNDFIAVQKEVISSLKQEGYFDNENGYKFAYFSSRILIDEELYYVRISVKKKIASNIFWIHNIDERKSSELLDPSKG